MNHLKWKSHINSIADHNPGREDLININNLIVIEREQYGISDVYLSAINSTSDKGDLVISCPIHWTLDDIYCALFISGKSFTKGFNSGVEEIQSSISQTLGLRREN